MGWHWQEALAAGHALAWTPAPIRAVQDVTAWKVPGATARPAPVIAGQYGRSVSPGRLAATVTATAMTKAAYTAAEEAAKTVWHR